MRLAAAVTAVAELPAEQRSVFVLHQLEGLTYDEVARVLHLTEPAVRNRLSRSRATLARRLREWT
jgi:RNA polymerase sigma-70 factor, ECF subfamily